MAPKISYACCGEIAFIKAPTIFYAVKDFRAE